MKSFSSILETIVIRLRASRCPDWSHIIIFEESDIKYLSLSESPKLCGHIKSEKIYKAENYEQRFQELIMRGYRWINISPQGLWNNDLLIIVEVPLNSSNYSADNTFINTAGLSKDPSGNFKWDVSSDFRVTNM